MTTTPLPPYAALLAPLEVLPATPKSLKALLASGDTGPAAQESMRWSPSRWAERFESLTGIDAFLRDLSSEPLDRASVGRHVTASQEHGRTDLAFVAAMAWGYGPAGYGPYRTARVLLAADGDGPNGHVLDRLRTATLVAREHGAVAGYYTLNNQPGRVRFLGPAFFTKWLYFTTAVVGPDDPGAAPILDLRVRNWIAENGGVHLRLDKTRDYARYLQLLDGWGALPDRKFSRATVERAIFALS